MQIKHTLGLENFNRIPGNIFVYWVGENIYKIYKNSKPIKTFCEPKQGIAASGNDLFLRKWYEVNQEKICFIVDDKFDYRNATFKYKWFLYSKGGDFRRWYGNEDYIFDYHKNGERINNHKGSVVRNPKYYYKECISWSDISSAKISFRYKKPGHIFDAAGPSIFFENQDDMWYTLALLNSKVISIIAEFMSPSLHFSVGQVAEYPYIELDEIYKEKIKLLSRNNIELSNNEWNGYETSFEFKKHPLI